MRDDSKNGFLHTTAVATRHSFWARISYDYKQTMEAITHRNWQWSQNTEQHHITGQSIAMASLQTSVCNPRSPHNPLFGPPRSHAHSQKHLCMHVLLKFYMCTDTPLTGNKELYPRPSRKLSMSSNLGGSSPKKLLSLR